MFVKKIVVVISISTWDKINYRVFTDELPEVEHLTVGLQPTGMP